MKKLFVSFLAAAAMTIASAATHNITLFQESIVSGTTLKPGEYKLTVDEGKAVIHKGKQRVEVAVTVENSDGKFNATSVRYQNGDGKYRVKEIRIGGTNTRLVVN